MSERWIVIPGWSRYQHYHDRAPYWLKDYVDQLDRDDYLGLTFAERGLLLDVRKLYARRNGLLRGDSLSLSRALGQRVIEKQLRTLNDAGWIEFSSSRPVQIISERLALTRSQETETETETDLRAETPALFKIPEELLKDIAPDDVATFASKLRDSDKNTQHVLQKLRRRVPFAAFASAYQALEYRRKKPPPLNSETRYYVSTVQALADEWEREGKVDHERAG